MPNQINDYLTFTKKERRGIMVLLVLIFMLLLLPYFIQHYLPNKYKMIDTNLQQQIAQLQIVKDTNEARSNYKNNYNTENRFVDFSPKWKNYASNIKGELFNFDPNTLDVIGWQKLGVSEKTAATIVKYTSKGGSFKSPEDISKIWGLNDDMVERLLPYVQINETNISHTYTNNYSNNYTKKEYKKDSNFNNTPYQNNTTTYTKNVGTLLLDINTADTIAWKKLPGIGSKLSERIVLYRNKLGGFNSVNQIAETFGLPDSTFQKIKANLVFKQIELTKVNINAASLNLLLHPYITKSLANNILQYKAQHGNYTNIEQLKNLALMDDATYLKLLPYIEVK
jgi:competence protein ComEA